MAHGRGHVQESVDDGVVVQQREGCEDLEAMVPADQQARTPVEQGHPGQNMVAPLDEDDVGPVVGVCDPSGGRDPGPRGDEVVARPEDRKSTRLNSSHVAISYAVFCLKKKKKKTK